MWQQVSASIQISAPDIYFLFPPQVTSSRLHELEQERLQMLEERELLSRQQDAMREEAGPRELCTYHLNEKGGRINKAVVYWLKVTFFYLQRKGESVYLAFRQDQELVIYSEMYVNC